MKRTIKNKKGQFVKGTSPDSKKRLVGKKFNKLTVICMVDNIYKTEKKPNGYCAALCQCDCGSDPVVINVSNLTSGHTKSCGCIMKSRVGKNHHKWVDMIGERSGKLKVLAEGPKLIYQTKKFRSLVVECSCGGSNPFIVSLSSFRSGRTKSCGCIRNSMLGENHPSWRGGYRTVNCTYCNKEIKKSKWVVENSENVFCGRKCHYKWNKENRIGENAIAWKGGPVKFKCDWCGKETTRDRGAFNSIKHHFCSDKCRSSWTSTIFSGEKSYMWKGGTKTVNCDQCGKQIERHPCNISDSNFCSTECFNKNKKDLGDAFIKSILSTRISQKINIKKITPEMIELKRDLIKYKRIEKEIKNVINS